MVRILIAICVLGAAFLPAGQVLGAGAEKELLKSLVLPDSPKDTAISADGKLFFVLTGKKVLIYDARGNYKNGVEVDGDPDMINVNPKGDTLFLTNSISKGMQVVSVDFVQEITIDGNPYKGNPEASVAIAVFSDFQ